MLSVENRGIIPAFGVFEDIPDILHARDNKMLHMLHLAINLAVDIGSNRKPEMLINANGQNAYMSPETTALVDLIVIRSKQVI